MVDSASICNSDRLSRRQTIESLKLLNATKFVVKFLSDDKYAVIGRNKISQDDRDTAIIGDTVTVLCSEKDGGHQSATIEFTGPESECDMLIRNLESNFEPENTAVNYLELIVH